MMDEIEDAELLRRYAEDRAEAAFLELMKRHLNLVYRAALRQTKGDAHRAEDITQAVFTQLARKAGSLARHPRLAGWLHTTTRFVTSATLRAERRRQMREQEAYSMHDISNLSDQNEGWDRVSPILDEVMRDLGEVDREAVLLHFFEGRSFADVGTRLSLREDAARMRVGRALDKLRTALARRGVVSTSAALALMLANESAIAAPAGLMTSVAGIAATFASNGAMPAISLLQLMNTSKLVITVTAGIGLIAAGGGVYYAAAESRESARTQAAIVATDNELSQMQDRLAAVTRRVTDAEKEYVTLEKIQAAPHASGPVTIKSAQKPANSNNASPDFKTLAKNTTYEKAFIANYHAQLRATYSGLYQQLGLTPEQVKRFEDVMTSRQQADYDVAASALDQGLAVDDASLQDLYAKNWEDMAASLQGMVTMQQVADYNKTKPGRTIASQLSTSLSFTDAPLTSAQSASLVQLIATYTADKTRQIDWGSVLAQAPGVLSAPQISMLSAVAARTQYNQAASNLASKGSAGIP